MRIPPPFSCLLVFVLLCLWVACVMLAANAPHVGLLYKLAAIGSSTFFVATAIHAELRE